MITDRRLSKVVHILLHLARQTRPLTSEVLARSMETHPVVIRRILSGLRENGFVRSEKGHGGGWCLARDLAAVSLLDVYRALGSPSLHAMGSRTATPSCFLERSVNAALDRALGDAERLFVERLGEVMLARVDAEARERRGVRGGCAELESRHAS